MANLNSIRSSHLFRLVAISLVVVVLASCLGYALPVPEQSSKPTGGCHQQGKPHTPASPDYRCCLAGHNVAAPQVLHLQVPDMHVSTPALVLALSAAKEISARPVAAFAPEFPPGAAPLRI